MSNLKFAPIQNPDTEAFWAGLREGRLLIQRCSACSTYRHPPSPICHSCLEGGHEWVEASGRGSVWSHSVVHEPLDGWPGEVPYTVVLVTLEENVKIISNLVEGSHEKVRIGAPVELVITQNAEGVALPRFRLTSEDS